MTKIKDFISDKTSYFIPFEDIKSKFPKGALSLLEFTEEQLTKNKLCNKRISESNGDVGYIMNYYPFGMYFVQLEDKFDKIQTRKIFDRDNPIITISDRGRYNFVKSIKGNKTTKKNWHLYRMCFYEQLKEYWGKRNLAFHKGHMMDLNCYLSGDLDKDKKNIELIVSDLVVGKELFQNQKISKKFKGKILPLKKEIEKCEDDLEKANSKYWKEIGLVRRGVVFQKDNANYKGY